MRVRSPRVRTNVGRRDIAIVIRGAKCERRGRSARTPLESTMQREVDFVAWERWFWACIGRARPRWPARLRPWVFAVGPDDDVMPADVGNPEGYFELWSIVRANDDLLAHFGGRWDSPPDFDGGLDRRRRHERLRATPCAHPGRTLRRTVATSSRTRESRSCCPLGGRSRRPGLRDRASCAIRWKWPRHCIGEMGCRC